MKEYKCWGDISYVGPWPSQDRAASKKLPASLRSLSGDSCKSGVRIPPGPSYPYKPSTNNPWEDAMGAHQRKGYFEVRALLLVAALAFALGLCFGAAWPYLLKSSGEAAWPAENVQEASIHIAAVRSDGLGVICNLAVQISPGDGRIWIDTHPLVGFDFQYADRTAVKVASEITGLALDADGVGIKEADIHFVISTISGENMEIQAIDGPSAGAATTIATIAAIENKKVKDNIIITGTVREDHQIGLVGGVAAKAKAANDAGIDLFLVSEGQYIEVYERVGFFTVVRHEPISYLQNYAQEHGWNVEIQEVSTIEEAAEIMLETV